MVPLALAQTLVPLAAILWLAFGRPLTPADMALRAVAAMALTFAVSQAGLWLAMPRATVMLLALLLLLAMIAAYRRNAAAPERPLAQDGIVTWTGRALTLAAAIAGSAASAIAIAGQGRVAPAIDLAFPFDEGRYLVVQGGSTGLINAHLAQSPLGQSHAIDLVRIDDIGFRTRSSDLLSSPDDAAAYRITGTRVIAPCGGFVEAAVDGQPDLAVPAQGTSGSLGNHVRIKCGANIVTLAGLRNGSIAVQRGRMVGKGNAIGTVGTSGEGGEPHLHIHAQRAAESGAASDSGAPVGIRFQNSSPVRNTQFAIE